MSFGCCGQPALWAYLDNTNGTTIPSGGIGTILGTLELLATNYGTDSDWHIGAGVNSRLTTPVTVAAQYTVRMKAQWFGAGGIGVNDPGTGTVRQIAMQVYGGDVWADAMPPPNNVADRYHTVSGIPNPDHMTETIVGAQSILQAQHDAGVNLVLYAEIYITLVPMIQGC